MAHDNSAALLISLTRFPPQPLATVRVLSGIGCWTNSQDSLLLPTSEVTSASVSATTDFAALDRTCTLHVGGQVDLSRVALDCVAMLHSVLLAPAEIGGPAALRRARRIVRDTIADAYRSAWGHADVRRLLMHGSHLMVGAAEDVPTLGAAYANVLAHLGDPVLFGGAPDGGRSSHLPHAGVNVAFDHDDLGSEFGEEEEEREGSPKASTTSWQPSLQHRLPSEGFMDHLPPPPLVMEVEPESDASPSPEPAASRRASLEAPVLPPPAPAVHFASRAVAVPPPPPVGPEPSIGTTKRRLLTPPRDAAVGPVSPEVEQRVSAGKTLSPSPDKKGDESSDDEGTSRPSVMEDFCMPFGIGLLLRMHRNRRAENIAKAHERKRLKEKEEALQKRKAAVLAAKKKPSPDRRGGAASPPPGQSPVDALSSPSLTGGTEGMALSPPPKDPGPIGISMSFKQHTTGPSMFFKSRAIPTTVGLWKSSTVSVPDLPPPNYEQLVWEQARNIVVHLVQKVCGVCFCGGRGRVVETHCFVGRVCEEMRVCGVCVSVPWARCAEIRCVPVPAVGPAP